VFIPIFLLLLLAGGLLSLALRDFVAPLQIQGNRACRPAAEVLLVLVRRYPMVFFLYAVLKIVFGVLGAPCCSSPPAPPAVASSCPW
jgi:hypothetical protein